MSDNKLKLLYEDISKDYEVGTYQEFVAYLSDDKKRAAFYNEIIKPVYEVNSQDEFESLYGLKKKEPTVSASSGSPSQSPVKTSLSPSFDQNWNATIKKAEETKKAEASKKKEADKQIALETPVVESKPKSFTEQITTSYANDVNRKFNQADNTTVQPAVKGIKNSVGKMVAVQQSRPTQLPAIEAYAGKGPVWKEADLTEIPTLIKQEGYKQFIAPIFKTIGIIQSDINNRIAYSIPGMMMEVTPSKIEDYAAYKFGKAVDYWAESMMYPVSQQTKESTLGQFTSGATSLGGFAVLGSLGTATGVGTIALPSLFGAMLNGSQEYERAYESTLDAQNMSDQEWYQKYTPGQDYDQAIASKKQMASSSPEQVAFDTWMGASVIGLSEGLPVMSWMSKMNRSTDGFFAKAMAKYLKEGVTKSTLQGAVEEGLQESFAQLFSNLNAIQVYDKTREVTEGVAESGTMGFLLGGALHGMTYAIQAKLADPSLPAGEKAIYEKTLEELKAKEEQTKNVKDDEVVKPFNDPDNVAELKKQKIQLELDFSDTKTPDNVKEALDGKIAEIDAQIEEAKAADKEAAVADMAKVGEKADLEAAKGELETQIESSTPATQELLTPSLEAINTELSATDLDKSIAELENIIAEDDLSLQTKGQAKLLPDARKEAEAQLETLKQQKVAASTTPDIQPAKEGVQQKAQETEAKIKRKDLFDGVGSFSKDLGGSDVESVPTNHTEKNGTEFVEYSNPKTGVVDIVITGKSDSDYVGYYRIYENGKPTNRWSSKIENASNSKADFKEMISGVQSLLPPGHEYTETTSISTDGLRIWNQQLNRGYELQYDKDGNVITNRVAINGAAKVNELGVPVMKGSFGKIFVKNDAAIANVKKAILPYLEKFGLNESNIHITNGIVEIDLPILKSNPKAALKTKAEPASKPATVTPQALKQGSTIDLPAQFKGGMPRTMVYDKGEWKQQIGNETSTVSQSIQEQAQKAYDSQNKPRVPGKVGVGQEPVQAKPVERGSQKEAPTSGNVQASEKVAPVENLPAPAKKTTAGETKTGIFLNKTGHSVVGGGMDFFGRALQQFLPEFITRKKGTEKNAEATDEYTELTQEQANKVYENLLKSADEGKISAESFVTRIKAVKSYLETVDTPKSRELLSKLNEVLPDLDARIKKLQSDSEAHRKDRERGGKGDLDNVWRQKGQFAKLDLSNLKVNDLFEAPSETTTASPKQIKAAEKEKAAPAKEGQPMKPIKEIKYENLAGTPGTKAAKGDLDVKYQNDSREEFWKSDGKMPARSLMPSQMTDEDYDTLKNMRQSINTMRFIWNYLHTNPDVSFDQVYTDVQNVFLPESRKLSYKSDAVKKEEPTKKEPVKEEPVVEEEVEEYTPLTKKNVDVGKFSKDEAVDYEEDEKEADNGRVYTYVSSMTVEVQDSDSGETVGRIVKVTDEDNNVNWRAEDVDGIDIFEDEFGSKAEALDALLADYNKKAKKEFDKEQKRKAKQKAKEMEKRAKAAEKVANSLKSAGIKVKFVTSEEMNRESQKRRAQAGNEGVFLTDTGEVLIDKENFQEGWGTNIVWHEGIHPILNIIRNTDPELYKAAVRGLKAAIKASPKSGLGNALAWANKEYEVDGEPTVNDEGLVESMARITDGMIDLNSIPRSAKQAIIDFINKIAKALGLGQVLSDTDMAKFKKLAGDIASILNEGRDIAELVGAENVKKYENSYNSEANSSTTGGGVDGNFTVQAKKGSAKKKPEPKGWLKPEMIVSIDDISNYEVSRVVFYDNTKVGPITLKNRLNGKASKADGMGGFGYSYIPSIEQSQGVLAFTNPNQAIQVLKRCEMYPGSIIGIAMQNQRTAHLGNVTTLNLLWGPKGQFEIAAKEYNAEKEIVDLFKKELVDVRNRRTKKEEVESLNTMIAAAKNANTIADIYNKVMKPAPFGVRNILNSSMLQDKPTNVTKATRASHEALHYKYGIPTLEEIQEAITDPHFKNAQTGDIVKYVKPFDNKTIYTTSEAAYKKYTEKPTDSMKSGGYKIELLPGADTHESYDFIITGENLGFGENYVGANEVFQSIKDKGIKKSQSFFPVGRMKADAESGRVEKSATRYGSPQASKGNREEIMMVNGVEEKVKPLPGGIDIVDGFYSPIEKKIAEFKQPNASANKWKEILGVKSDEAQFSGLADWLNSKRPDEQIKKTEIQQFIKDNRIEIKEIVKGTEDSDQADVDDIYNNVVDWFGRANEDAALEDPNNPVERFYNNPSRKSYDEMVDFAKEYGVTPPYYGVDNTRHSYYTLPGEKENYKETLITLPNKTKDALVARVSAIDNRLDAIDNELMDTRTYKKVGNTGTIKDFELEVTDKKNFDRLTAEKKQLEEERASKFERIRKEKEGEFYKKGHYDEADILVHARTDVRYDSNGDKVLFIEEVQSDWGQTGREEGFSDNKKLEELKKEFKELKNILTDRSPDVGPDEINERYHNIDGEITRLINLKSKGLKTAPYVQDTNAWTKLGLKVAIKQAVAAGAKSIAWTTGQQQAKRFDVRKTVDTVSYKQNEDGTYNVNASKEGVSAGYEDNATPKILKRSFGKGIADRILAGEGRKSIAQGMEKDLTGDQLAFGDEGMIAYYGDEAKPGIIGSVAKALVKELTGVTPEINQVKIAASDRSLKYAIYTNSGHHFRPQRISICWIIPVNRSPYIIKRG